MRSQRMIIALGLIFAFSVTQAQEADAPETSARLADVVIVIDPAASELEQLAAKEMTRYIAALTGVQPIVVKEDKVPAGRPAIILASADRTVVRAFVKKIKGTLPELGNEGFLIHTFDSEMPRVLVTGNSPISIVYGTYELLEKYGIRFYISDEVVPAADSNLLLKKWDLICKPELAVRGTLPWYNFLMGATAWRLEDYKAYIDQLLKMKYNMVGFHLYSADLFFHFTYKGITVPEEKLYWHPAYYPTDKISIGREHFTGDGEFFGAPGGTKLEVNEKVFSEALAYARSRGFKTAVGFELDEIPQEMLKQMPASVLIGKSKNLDPTSPEAEEFLRIRLKALVDMYPDVNYYWLWYTEGGRWDQIRDDEFTPSFREFYQRNIQNFKYDMFHITPTAGVAHLCWLQKAHVILRELKPDAQIMTGGWTVDAMLPGLDKALPRDIALSSLSSYEPEWSMQNLLFDRYWKGIDRTRIVTSWFEFDGRCIGLTQPKTKIYGPLLRKVKEAGIDGAIMLHWRTRILDMNFSYFAEKAWGNPMDSYEFYVDYAGSRYGTEAMEEARRAHALLENYEEFILANIKSTLCKIALDYSAGPWVFVNMVKDIKVAGPTGLTELVIPDDKFYETYASLIDMNNPLSIPHASALLKNARFWFASALSKAKGDANKERLNYMICRVDYYLLYLESHQMLITAWTEYRNAVKTGDKEALKTGITRAIEIARKAPVEATVKKYAEYITNRGEQGVLVSLNRKVWDGYQMILTRLEEAQRAVD